MQLRFLDLPVFSYLCLYAGNVNHRHVDQGYADNIRDSECLASWASINSLTLLCHSKNTASFYTGRWNTGTNSDLAFGNVDPNSCLPDRRVLEKFRKSQHLPLLISGQVYQGLLRQCQACLLSNKTSPRLNEVTRFL